MGRASEICSVVRTSTGVEESDWSWRVCNVGEDILLRQNKKGSGDVEMVAAGTPLFFFSLEQFHSTGVTSPSRDSNDRRKSSNSKRAHGRTANTTHNICLLEILKVQLLTPTVEL